MGKRLAQDIPTEYDEQRIPAFCPCGCGAKTNRAPRTDKAKKWIKGQPLYKKGHNTRTKLGWYQNQRGVWQICMPSHPNARRAGHVFQHTIIASNILGRPLKKDEQVHHVNGCPSDNRNKNLVICESYNYHALLHRRADALKNCGNVNWRKCVRCKKYDDLKNLKNHGNGCYVHEECRRAYKKAWYDKSRANRI